MKKGQPRRLLALGSRPWQRLVAMFRLNLDADFLAIALPRSSGLRLGLFSCRSPLQHYVNIQGRNGNASGIFNLLRQSRRQFGIAAATTLVSQRSAAHQTFLTEK